VQIPDVVGLANELALRISKGVGFGVNRTAVINQAGQIDAASGSPDDCVRVDEDEQVTSCLACPGIARRSNLPVVNCDDASAVLSKRSYGACLPSTTISCDRKRFTKQRARKTRSSIGPDCRVGRTRRSPPTLTPST
jgi:hypothetical protein